MEKGTEISVIIPNFNYGNYIEECINSVISSDFDHSAMEIVVVDDASTDNSVKNVNKIKKTTDIKINLIKHKVNQGLAKTRNTGIKNAKGKYLFFLDSDNYINKDCLKKHYEFLKGYEEYSACYAPIQRFDNETKELKGIFSNEPYDYHRLTFGNYIDAMSMIKKDDLLEVGLYDEQMPCSGWEDYDLWLRMGVHNKKIHFLTGEPLTQYRVHTSSMVHSMPPINQYKLVTYIKNKFNLKESENINSPLTLILVQIFYSQIKFGFTEEKSMVNAVKLIDSPYTVSFNLPPTEESYNFIRFDLGDTPGLINIHDIDIRNSIGEILWKWNKYTTDFKSNLFFFSNENIWPGKIVQLSTWIDPQFMISTNELVQKESVNGITVNISLSSLNKVQFEQVNGLTIPFSSISEKQFTDITQENNALLSDKENLLHEISVSKSSLQNLEEKNKLIQQTIKADELLVDQLINDKKYLLSEIDIKNDVINKVFLEKEKNEKTLSEDTLIIEKMRLEKNSLEISLLNEKNIAENLKKNVQTKEHLIEGLEKDNQNKEKILAHVQHEKNALENVLSNKQYLIEEIKKDNQIKDNTIAEINIAKKLLETSLINKQDLIEKLQNNIQSRNEEISQLNIKTSFLETELSNKKQVIEKLQKDNQDINSKFNDEHKNAVQLINYINSLKEDIIQLKQQNNELHTLQKNKTSELENYQKTNNSLNAQVESLRQTVNEYEEKYIKSGLWKTIITKLKNNQT